MCSRTTMTSHVQNCVYVSKHGSRWKCGLLLKTTCGKKCCEWRQRRIQSDLAVQTAVWFQKLRYASDLEPQTKMSDSMWPGLFALSEKKNQMGVTKKIWFNSIIFPLGFNLCFVQNEGENKCYYWFLINAVVFYTSRAHKLTVPARLFSPRNVLHLSYCCKYCPTHQVQ